MAERAVPGYVFEDIIKCNWVNAYDNVIYNNGVPSVAVELPFKFEQVRDCSSHIKIARTFNNVVKSVSSTLNGKSWSSVYGNIP